MERSQPFAILLAAALLGGCRQPSNHLSPGGGGFPGQPLATVTTDSGRLRIAVRPAPEQPPPRGLDSVQYTITGAGGAPQDGLQVRVEPWMPQMSHGGSVLPQVVPEGGGIYLLRNVYLFMAGDWQLRTFIAAADGSSDHAVIDITVGAGSGGEVQPDLGPLGNRLITTNQGDATLSVVDPGTGKLVGPILVPPIDELDMEMPHELSTDPRGRFLIACLMEMPLSDASLLQSGDEMSMMISNIPGWLLKFDSNGNLIGKTQIDPDPGDNALSGDGSVAYVSHYDLATILKLSGDGDSDPRHMDSSFWAIDTATMQPISKIPVCPAAHVIELSADGRTAYLTCIADEVAMVNISNPHAMTVQRIPEVPGAPEDPTSPTYQPYALQVSPLDGSVWVSNWIGKNISIMDVSNGSAHFDGDVSMKGATPIFSTFSASGKLLYVCHQGPGGIAVLDGQSRRLIADHLLDSRDCINPHQLVLSGDEQTGYLLCEGDHAQDGQFVRLDLTDWKVLSSVPIGVYPVEEDILPPPGG